MNDTPVQPVLCDKIRQHYCPKFFMTEIGTLHKTDSQKTWACRDTKFRDKVKNRNL